MLSFISRIADSILKGGEITFEEAFQLSMISKQQDIFFLFGYANKIRETFKGSRIDLCAIINAKSGSCSENCKFCSQSAHYNTSIEKYPLLSRQDVVLKAMEASDNGANRFSIVISGRGVSDIKELDIICNIINEISSKVKIGTCASLGTLSRDAIKKLKQAGLKQYHHNLETSDSFFPRICTTHSYKDRVKMVKIVKEEGLKICCGGIFGLGETNKERLELAFALKELAVDSIPLNFLNPIPGTPLQKALPVAPLEILKIIAIFRFINPSKDIRVCGGRQRNLKDAKSFIYVAGANGVMIGDYLTTQGSNPEDDLQLIDDLNLKRIYSGRKQNGYHHKEYTIRAG